MRQGVTAWAAFGLLTAFASMARGQDRDATNLPAGPAPLQALAKFEAGRFIIKQPVVHHYYVPITRFDLTEKAATTTYEMKRKTGVQVTTTDNVRAHDVRGNPIAPKRLRKLLRDEIPVLLSIDGKSIDPLHLRLYKDDVVILMIPTGPGPNAVPADTVRPEAPPEIKPEAAPARSLLAAAGHGDLTIRIYGPRENALGLQHRYQIEVENRGGAKVTTAKTLVHLPKGLATISANVKIEDAITADVGDIAPGNTRSLDLNVSAARAGAYEIRVVLTAEPDYRAELKFSAKFADVAPPSLEAPPPIILVK